MQDDLPGRALLVVAGLGEADDRSQGGQVTEMDAGQIEVQDTGAVGGIGQRDGQRWGAAYVELAGQEELRRVAAAGDGEMLVAGQDAAAAAGRGAGRRSIAVVPGPGLAGAGTGSRRRVALAGTPWAPPPGARRLRRSL